MSDTNFFDVVEKVDILIKQSFGFPSTSENKQWYEETAVEYNNYLNGEELLLDIIPRDPDFDISGIVRTATEIGLNNSDFVISLPQDDINGIDSYNAANSLAMTLLHYKINIS